MAKIKYYVRSKKKLCKIYVRFSNGRKINFRKITPLITESSNFNNTTGTLKTSCNSEEDLKLKEELEKLSRKIISKFNKESLENKSIDRNWFDSIIDNHFNQNISENSNMYLKNYTKEYIKELPTKTDIKGKFGCKKSTIAKYHTILNKITEYEKFSNRRIRLTDVDLSFRDDFLKFLLKEQKLNENTSGRYIKFLKTICLSAKRKGIPVNFQLDLIKGFSVKTEKITLDFRELKLIEETNFEDERLNSAKDWLLIGCYIGQRVSDLLTLTSKNLVLSEKMNFIELIQKKTNKKVSILIHPKVLEILKKRNYNFPQNYSQNIASASTIFNKLIKIVANKSKLNYEVNGAMMNPETNRKIKGIFPKYKLITSHICRRSFATNFYGDIPTPLLINITGHSTEKEFLNYIGKTQNDYAEQLAKYWNI